MESNKRVILIVTKSAINFENVMRYLTLSVACILYSLKLSAQVEPKSFGYNEPAVMDETMDTLRSVLPNPSENKEIVIYRSGNKWGLTNKDKKILVDPIYDEIEPIEIWNNPENPNRNCSRCYFPHGVFIDEAYSFPELFSVKSDGGYGVIYEDRLIVEPEFGMFKSISKYFLIEFKGGALFNLKGEKLFDYVEHLREFRIQIPNKKNIFVFGVRGVKNGIFLYDISTQKIVRWIYESDLTMQFRDNYCDRNPRFYQVSKNATGYSYDLMEIIPSGKIEGNTVIKVSEQTIAAEKAKLAGLETDLQPLMVEMGKQYYKKIEHKIRNQTCLGIEILRGYSFKSEEIIDTLKMPKTFIEKFEIHEFNTRKGNFFLPTSSVVDKLDTLIEYMNYATFKTINGTNGIIIGKQLIKSRYLDIKEIPFYSQELHFTVSIRDSTGAKKWGIINRFGETVAPFVFDEILQREYYGYYNALDRFIVRVGHKYGILNPLSGSLEVEAIADKINTKTFQYFDIVIANKHGVFISHAYETGRYLDAVFNYPLQTVAPTIFGSENYYRLKDSTGTFLGYANKKGEDFFD
jgi:hypothetical protein